MSGGIRREDWIMLASSVVVLTMAYSAWASFSVFLVAIGVDLHWSRWALSSVVSVYVIAQALAVPFSGKLADHLSPLLVIRVGIVIVSAGIAGCGWATELWHFYLMFGLLVGAGGGIAGYTPVYTAIRRRFDQPHIGFVMGVASMGLGLPVAVMLPIGQLLIQSVGWRGAYYWLAVIVFVLGQVFATMVKVGRPPASDQMLANENHMQASAVENVSASSAVDCDGWTLTGALKSRQFWLSCLTFFCFSVGINMVLLHQVAYLVDVGQTTASAAIVGGLVGWVALPFKVIWGLVSDRFGREIAWTLGSLVTFFAVVLLLLVGNLHEGNWVPFAYGTIFGAGWAANAPLQAAIIADLFPGKNFGSIWGAVCLFVIPAAAVGPLIGGYVYDTTGIYEVAFYVAAGTLLVTSVMIWFATMRGRHPVGGRPSSSSSLH